METTSATTVYEQLTLPVVPLSLLIIALCVALPIASLWGYFSGRASYQRHRASGRDIDPRIGETTVTAFFGIVGLLLAFSFGNGLAKNAATTTALVEEAAALSTVFARADYLPEPGKTEIKQAILAYANTRHLPDGVVLRTVSDGRAFIDRSLEAQTLLWPLTVEHTADPVPPAIKAFFASAMNDALDAHLHRMRTITEPISVYSQAMVLGTTLAALFLAGNRAGLMGRQLTWRTFVLSASFAGLMVTIVDMGRSFEGFIQIDEGTLRATILEMETALRQ
ncbi:MAG: hypothetical protein AB8B58_01410 [Roseobacter sp.]